MRRNLNSTRNCAVRDIDTKFVGSRSSRDTVSVYDPDDVNLVCIFTSDSLHQDLINLLDDCLVSYT